MNSENFLPSIKILFLMTISCTIFVETIDEEAITDLELIIDVNVVYRFGTFKRKRSEEEPLPELPARTKNEICQKIFGSSFFEDESWVDPDQGETRHLLETGYPELFETVYQNENKYKEYVWSIRGSEYLHAFTCLVRNQGKITRHYVSEVYHLTLNRDPDEADIELVGRFILYGDQQMYMEAFAADGSDVTVGNENFVVEGAADLATLKVKPSV